MAFRTRVIAISLLLAGPAWVSAITQQELPEPAAIDPSLHSRIEQLKEYKSPETKNIEAIISSDAYRKKIDTAVNRTTAALNLQVRKGERILERKNDETFVLFVSSSMPVETLRNYVRDLYLIDGIMVLKGMVGDETKIKPTLDFIRTLIVEDPTCTEAGCPVTQLKVAIDPARFVHYNIDQVPAGVIEYKPSFEPNCNEARKYDSRSEIVFGDASVQGILLAMNQKRPNPIIDKLLKQLENQ